MIETFGIVGVCILAAIAVGVGIVGIMAWIWFGREDDCEKRDEGRYDWLKEQDEMKERKDNGSR